MNDDDEPRGRRLTENRVTELHSRLARIEARLDRLEARKDAAQILAEELGNATLRAAGLMHRVHTTTTTSKREAF